MQFRVIMVTDPRTNKPTNTHTNRQDRLQYTAPLSLVCTVIITAVSYEKDTVQVFYQFHTQLAL